MVGGEPQRGGLTTTVDPLDDLGAYLVSLSDTERAALLATLNEADLEVAAAAITRIETANVDWRATPAHMAHHLTKGGYQLYPYILLMANRIAGAFNGTLNPHQQIWIPSQMGKTVLVGNHTPVWALDRNPALRIMYVSYDADKAVEECGKARDFANDHSADLRFELRQDRRARGRWSTPQGGGLYGVGVNGSIVGFPADVLVVDDIFKGWREAHSPTVRAGVWAIWGSQIRMRVQGSHCPIIAVGTRWHDDDVAARLLKLAKDEPDADQWSVTRLAAFAEAPDPKAEEEVYRQPDPLGRAPGEVIEPRRFPAAEVRSRAAAAGPYLAGAIEQQRPTPEEGGEILREWWRYEDDAPAVFDDLISSWDAKMKDAEAGDYAVGQVWGRTGSSAHFIASMRGQWNQTTIECAIALTEIRFPAIRAHYIENAAKGPEIAAALRSAHPNFEMDAVTDKFLRGVGMTDVEKAAVVAMRRRGLGRIHMVPPVGSKAVRMRAQSGFISGRDVYLLTAGWNAAFVNEMAGFPNSQFDDQIDCCSQALLKLMRSGASTSSATTQLPKTTIDTRQGGTLGVTAPVRSRRNRIMIPRATNTGR